MRTYRSFRDLPRDLIQPDLTLRAANGAFVPSIPCANCGRFVMYTHAVHGVGDGWVGYIHDGTCDPTDVAEWTRKNQNVADALANRRATGRRRIGDEDMGFGYFGRGTWT